MLYGYCRVSTDMQDASSEAQQAALDEYAKRTNQTLAEVFSDEDVSGSVPLRDRPSGKRMWDRLQRGDTVVVTTRDRGFRSLVDAATTLMLWREQGIRLHIIDFPVDLTTDEGELVFLQGAVFSQYERKMIGKRIKRGIDHRKKTGQPYGGTRPWGWIKTDGKWVPLPKERTHGNRMLVMRKAGCSWNTIAVACMDCRKPSVRKNGSGYYHVADVRTLVRAAEAGYPKIAPVFWRDPGCGQKLAELKSVAPLLFSAE
jgi:DNA invertase Pin-like site-specific DNA recombinase